MIKEKCRQYVEHRDAASKLIMEGKDNSPAMFVHLKAMTDILAGSKPEEVKDILSCVHK